MKMNFYLILYRIENIDKYKLKISFYKKPSGSNDKKAQMLNSSIFTKNNLVIISAEKEK